ncbi:hypothetical protein LXA43DRAFT_1010791 [Ganoderma leucocontextum]|nr:hypothetical protein LXA43DRAFT_1010791 [Ganoderma leucocontextum]
MVVHNHNRGIVLSIWLCHVMTMSCLFLSTVRHHYSCLTCRFLFWFRILSLAFNSKFHDLTNYHALVINPVMTFRPSPYYTIAVSFRLFLT